MRVDVLHVTRNFPPLVGGMERLNFHIHRELSEVFSLALCGPRGAERYLEAGSVVSSCASAPIGRFLASCQIQTAALAVRYRPRLVLAGSGLTSVAARAAGALVAAPVLTYVHGLDLVADSRLYRALFLPAIRGSARVIANSQNTQQLAMDRGIRAERLTVLNPGVSNYLRPSDSAVDAFLTRHGLHGRRVMLSVGRLTARKGLAEFVACCLPGVVQAVPDAVLVIVGGEARNAVGSSFENVTARIMRSAERSKIVPQVLMLGEVDEAELALAYACAVVHVFPVLNRPGDVEGFGMVAVEAAAAGLPSVAFESGGVRDAIESGVSGLLIPPGDYRAMRDALVSILTRASDLAGHGCREFSQRFSWSRFGERLRAIVQDAMR